MPSCSKTVKANEVEHPGVILDNVLKERGISQKDLSDAIGKSTPVINDIIKPEIRAGMLAAARHVHAEPVELADIDRACGHPTRLGMRRIAKQIARALELAPGGAP